MAGPDPEALVAQVEARCRRVETPCGQGAMVWRVWGAGTPVVLGHGAQGSWNHWLRTIDALTASGRMVIVPDLPGHGDSAEPVAENPDAMGDALAAGLRAVVGAGVPVDLVGFSFGGVALSCMAARHPETARRIILVGCGGLDTPHGHVDLRRISGLRGEERDAAIKANLLGLMLHHPETVDAFARYQLIASARLARYKTAQQFVMPDRLIRVLPQVTVPVDAIWGELDRPHPDPAAQAAALRRIKPEADFRVIPGAGHWVMYERPEAFNAALIAMLDRVPG